MDEVCPSWDIVVIIKPLTRVGKGVSFDSNSGVTGINLGKILKEPRKIF
jgi:hypothetical protein